MSEEMKNLNEQSEETVVETPETQVENVEPTVEFVKPQFIEKKPLDKKTLGIIAGAAAAVVVILGIIIGVVLGGGTPPAQEKTYNLVVVTDSAVNASNNKVSNTLLVLVIDADGKIVAARFDCAEVTPSLVDGAIANVDSVITKVEKGDGYTGMAAGSWADQAKAFEDYLIGKTAAEVAAMDTADKTLIAGCTMSSSKATFKALVAKAFASTLKVEFKAAGDITVGAAISTKIASGKVSSDFAGVVLAGGKVAATMIDSCELKFTVTDGAIVAPATPAVSKNDQGEEYSGMPAGPWYKQAQAFANSTVGKTLAELADLETVSDALTAAGCTMKNTTAGYKATIIKAVEKVTAPVEKDYTLVVVTDSAVNASNKVSNTLLVLVIDADGKIVAARFDCAEVTPSLVDGAIANVDSVITKVEKGDGYTGMSAGSWADQAKAFEDYLIGKTAAEVAAMDTADKTLIAGCTMSSSKATFKALVAKAFASTLKVEFKAAGDITVGAAINTKIASNKVSSDFAGVVLAGGKVVATMIDSCEQKFTVADGAIVAPATPAVSKNDQGEEYSGMPAGPWYKQAQAFANSTVGKTVAELADLETVSDALAAAGCTMKNTTAGYKTTIIAAAGYAR